MPKVSVIIPTYNNAQFLPETLDCVLNQTIKDVEVLVIDDGSTDNTKDVMAQYTDQYPDQVKYVVQKNQGPAAARNNGIKQATGDYVAFVDSDDLWEKEKLEIQLAFLEKNPDYSFAYSDVYAMDEEGRIGKTMMSLKHPVSGDIFYPLLKENFVSIPTSIVNRKCFETVEGFCEDPQIISTEDHHFWLKLANYFKGGFIDKPLAKYRIRSGSLSSQGIRQRERELLVIDKISKEFPAKYSSGKKTFS